MGHILNMSAVALLLSRLQPSDWTCRDCRVCRSSSASWCFSERRRWSLASDLAHSSPSCFSISSCTTLEGVTQLATLAHEASRFTSLLRAFSCNWFTSSFAAFRTLPAAPILLITLASQANQLHPLETRCYGDSCNAYEPRPHTSEGVRII